MSAIDNLQTAIKNAAGNPFALDAKFLGTGLDDPDITVPPDYDSWIQSAFVIREASKFLIEVDPENVGPVEGDSFTVKTATVPFISASSPLTATATLIFALDGKTLVVQIATTPTAWTWTDSFQFMGGFPFNQLTGLEDTQFVFSTAAGRYPFGDDGGEIVSPGAIQNFRTKLPLPSLALPFLALFDGLAAPTGNLSLSGPMNMALFNGETVLFPPGTFNASIEDGGFKLLYLEVEDPALSLTIPEPEGSGEEGRLDDDDPDAGDQSPSLSISSRFGVGGAGETPYNLQVEILPALAARGETPRKMDLARTRCGGDIYHFGYPSAA